MEARFSEVRVFDAGGALKRIIPVSKMRKVHWERFEDRAEMNKRGDGLVFGWKEKSALDAWESSDDLFE